MVRDYFIGMAVWSGIVIRLLIMALLGVVVYCIVYILEQKDGRKRLWGITLFGSLLIVGSIYKLWGFRSYEYYQFMFQQLSEESIFVRYLGSIMLRIFAIIVAAGVLLLKESCRKLFVLLCVFTLCILYWKHPFYVFENIARLSEQMILRKEAGGELTNSLYPWISLAFHYAIDILFSGTALYYFTRSKVKEQFI